MSRFIRALFILNYAFWSIFFLWSFILFIGYNGLFNLFTFSCQVGGDLNIQTLEKVYKIDYSYSNGVEKFHSTERVSKNIFNNNIEAKNYLKVCYNSRFPTLSYIDEPDLSIYRNKVSMVISLIFLIFFLLIDLPCSSH
jgi:hypothetical protein